MLVDVDPPSSAYHAFVTSIPCQLSRGGFRQNKESYHEVSRVFVVGDIT